MTRAMRICSVVLLTAAAFIGCATDRAGRKSESVDPADVPVLIEAERLPEVLIERRRKAKSAEEIDELRQQLCGESEDDVIFYQLIVGKHWHYYWLCSESDVQRAATTRGDKQLRQWVEEMQNEAQMESRQCTAGQSEALFNKPHESGTSAQAFCDGQIALIFPDGGKKWVRFTAAPIVASSQSALPRATSAACPPPDPCPTCPKCPACATPRCDDSEGRRKAGEAGFWQGVAKACKRICTLVYQHCRSLNPNTSLCYQVSEHCAANCLKK